MNRMLPFNYPSMFRLLAIVVGFGCVTSVRMAHGQSTQPYAPSAENGTWALTFESFFAGENRGRPKNLNIYPRREKGQWSAAVVTTTTQGKASYNTMLHMADMSGTTFKGNKLTGTIVITLAADPWVPSKEAGARFLDVQIEAEITPPAAGADSLGTVKGTWKATLRDADRILALNDKSAGLDRERSGSLSGGIGPHDPDPSVDNISVDLVLPFFAAGKVNEPFQSRKGLSFGLRGGQVISTRIADVDIRNAVINHVPVDAESSVTVTATRVSGKTRFRGETLDGEYAGYSVTFEGERSVNMLVGKWTAEVTTEGGAVETRSGYFRGGIGNKPSEAKFVRDERPWYVPVPDFKEPEPGEHPRLFFRKSDLPKLRERANTPDGKAIIARLRKLLNGSDGESMPTVMNPATRPYDDNKFKQVPGNYSISHAAGFGFLYQLTGDKKYADLARQCMDLALKGQRDFDDRYSWDQPGGELRAGPALGWYAVAYDLCYDAWDPEYRQKIALAIQNYNVKPAKEEGVTDVGTELSLKMIVFQPRHGPSSNHYGAALGGAGLAVLAIKGDPGTNSALLQKYDDVLQRGIVKGFTNNGFGDGGFFNEGAGPGQIFSDTAFVPYLQALRVCQGRDYIDNARPHVPFMTLLRIYELVGPPAMYPYRSSMSSSYGGPDFMNWRSGLSRGGQFAQGFGAIPERYKAALLYTFNTFVEPDKEKYTYDTVSLYPHRPMLALINWPFGTAPQNPAEVLPKTHVDNYWQYYVFRNAWSGPRDIVVTNILRGNGVKPRGIMVWGYGNQRLELGETSTAMKPLEYKRGVDGSGSVVINSTSAFVVDFSKASGADALIIRFYSPVPEKAQKDAKPAGKPDPNAAKAKRTTLSVGELRAEVLTLSDGAHPDPSVDQTTQAVVVGNQKISFDGTTVSIAEFKPAK